jgi:hypothetical protein
MGADAVFFNPASIAGSPFKWNVNLFSINPFGQTGRFLYGLAFGAFQK